MGFRALILALCMVLTVVVTACGTDTSDVGDSPEPIPTPIPEPEPPPGSPGAPGSLNEPRANHTTTLMPDGTVLAVAGSRVDRELDSVESYDPQTGLWTLVSSLGAAREGHTATLLPDGRVVVAGGAFKVRALSSVEIYDPSSDSWTDAAPMNEARSEHTATLLPNGRILADRGSGPAHGDSGGGDIRSGVGYVEPGGKSVGCAVRAHGDAPVGWARGGGGRCARTIYAVLGGCVRSGDGRMVVRVFDDYR